MMKFYCADNSCSKQCDRCAVRVKGGKLYRIVSKVQERKPSYMFVKPDRHTLSAIVPLAKIQEPYKTFHHVSETLVNRTVTNHCEISFDDLKTEVPDYLYQMFLSFAKND